jgi:hypothetical protein
LRKNAKKCEKKHEKCSDLHRTPKKREKNVKNAKKHEKSLCKAEHFSGVQKVGTSKMLEFQWDDFRKKRKKNAKKRHFSCFFVFFRVFGGFWGVKKREKMTKN